MKAGRDPPSGVVRATAVPVSACAAVHGPRDAGGLQAGQTVLIVGASGGVGTFAVQLAKPFGADVPGVCRAGKLDLVRSIGADRVIDYTCEDFADGAHRYDLILDTAGSRSLSHLRRRQDTRTRDPAQALTDADEGHSRGKAVIIVASDQLQEPALVPARPTEVT